MATKQSTKKPQNKRITKEQHIERKLDKYRQIVTENPSDTLLVTTTLNESKVLAQSILEFESGLTSLRMALGGRISFDQGKEIYDRIEWATAQVRSEADRLNELGFGQGQTMYVARERKQTETKRLSRLKKGDKDQVALAERIESLKASRAKEDDALIAKRIAEDAKIAEKRAKEDAELKLLIDAENAKFDEERRAKEQARKEADKAKKKAAHEQRVKEQQERKAKEKAERIAAHEKRMKEQQEAKAKRLAEEAANSETTKEKVSA
jgi:hypothetical protein